MKFPWSRRSPSSKNAIAYEGATPSSVGRKTPIDQLTFVVLDAETTGFDPVKDRILSLAVLPVKKGQLEVAGLRSWLVFQSQARLTAAVSVHGILPSETRTGQPEEVVVDELLPLLSGAVLVGHHLGFDVAMLNAALRRHCNTKIMNPLLDTAAYAQHVLEPFRKTGYPGQRMPSLDEVCTHCEITPMERHTAPGDTFTTAEMFLVLCAKQARLLGRPLVAGDLPLASA